MWQDVVDKDGLLGLAQPLVSVAFGPIDEPGDPLCVEALDSVAQGRALHPSRSRGLSPAHPVQGVGYGQKPQGGTSPALRLRPAAQICRCPQVRSDRDRSSHRSLLATAGDHKPITQGIPPESPQPRGGISPYCAQKSELSATLPRNYAALSPEVPTNA